MEGIVVRPERAGELLLMCVVTSSVGELGRGRVYARDFCRGDPLWSVSFSFEECYFDRRGARVDGQDGCRLCHGLSAAALTSGPPRISFFFLHAARRVNGR